MKSARIELVNYSFIIVGSFIMAIGIVGFLLPNHIATGGTAGLAIVLEQMIHLPVGLLMGLINVPLLLISIKYLGKKFAVKTMICISFIVVFVDVLAQWIQLHSLSNNLMLATLYGGVTVGIGLGLIFKGGASAGGGTILAKIIATNTSVKTSTVILILDALVITSAGIVFKSIELALWSLISIYVASKLIDVVLVGANNQKIVHISSAKNLKELSLLITQDLGISGTIIKGNDLGDTEYKDIIFIMIDKNKLTPLKQLVLQYDENVKMIVMEATEILGKDKIN
jgi:uncharacterized membrane-anchored protein YitT (DUF2179 family)